MPYGYHTVFLPPDSGYIPALTPAEAILGLATSEGCKTELTWVVVISGQYYN